MPAARKLTDEINVALAEITARAATITTVTNRNTVKELCTKIQLSADRALDALRQIKNAAEKI